jgi:hypothetical protein
MVKADYAQLGGAGECDAESGSGDSAAGAGFTRGLGSRGHDGARLAARLRTRVVRESYNASA